MRIFPQIYIVNTNLGLAFIIHLFKTRNILKPYFISEINGLVTLSGWGNTVVRGEGGG
jgi:hypothetical protein